VVAEFAFHVSLTRFNERARNVFIKSCRSHRCNLWHLDHTLGKRLFDPVVGTIDLLG
jgi:hypothetical protein